MKNDIILVLLSFCLISSGLAYTFYNQHIEYKSKIETTTDNEFNFSVTGVTEDGIELEFFVICDVKAKKGDILLDDIKNKFSMSLNNTPIYDIDRLKDNFVSELGKDELFWNEITIVPTEDTTKLIDGFTKIRSV
jgi:hypothetical protein